VKTHSRDLNKTKRHEADIEAEEERRRRGQGLTSLASSRVCKMVSAKRREYTRCSGKIIQRKS